MSDVTSGMVMAQRANEAALETDLGRMYAAYIRPPDGRLWPKEAMRIAKGLVGKKAKATARHVEHSRSMGRKP